MGASKKNHYGNVRPQRQRPRRRVSTMKSMIRMLSFTAAILALAWFIHNLLEDNPIGLGHYGTRFVDWDNRRKQVKNAFTTSWDAYAKVAFGLSACHLHRYSAYSLIPPMLYRKRQVSPFIPDRLTNESEWPRLDHCRQLRYYDDYELDNKIG